MKKLALILALMLIPCTAFGLEMLNDNMLEEVTGQSGVSIAFDDVQLFLHVDKFAYIDCDGYSTNSNYGGTCESNTGGAIVIENFEMDMININMIGLAGYGALYYEGASGVNSTVITGAWNELNVSGALGLLTAAGVTESDWVNGNTVTISTTAFDLSTYHDHINGEVAYSLEFDGYYRNAGNQTGEAYTPGYFDTTGIYHSYEGSLPLGSAECGSIPLFYNYGRTDSGGCGLGDGATDNFGLNHYVNTNNISTIATFHPQAVTIDVTGKLPLHSSGMAKAADPGSKVTIGGVLIGLPTAEFHIQQMSIGAITFDADIYGDNNNNDDINLATGQAYEDDVKNSGESFGSIFIEGVTFTTFGGWMEIAPTYY